MKRKKLLSMILGIVIVSTSVLAGCSTSKDKPASADAKKEPKVLNYYTPAEPQTLDAQKIIGQPEFSVDYLFIEGLVRYGKEDGKFEPGVAKSWKFDQASNTYTFELRKDAKWADGTAVTSADFIYAWKLALDTGAPYNFLMTTYIVGADEYSQVTKESFLSGKDAAFKALLDQKSKETDKEKKKELNTKISDRIAKMTDAEKSEFDKIKSDLWAKTGMKEKDGNITIQLSQPCPFFLGLVCNNVFSPVNEKFYTEHTKAGDYCLEAKGMPADGPWVLKEWKHNDNLVLEKNPNYWNKDAVNIDKINMKVIIDTNTRTNLLKTGELDGSAIQSEDLKTFQDKATRDQYKLDDMEDKPDYSVFYLDLNQFNNKYTMNLNIRKAILYALDRKGFVEKVSLGDLPALGVVPDHFPGLEKSFREENGKELIQDNQKDKAKEFLAKGLKELGIDKLPSLDMVIASGDVDQKQAEKVQSDLKEIGIDIKISPVPWSEKLSRLQAGNFAIAGDGWGPDFLDPITYFDLFKSDNPNNYGKYNNPKYDALIQSIYKESDSKKRMGYMYEAEKMLMDDAVLVPHYYRIAHRVAKQYLTDVVTRGIGPSPDFYWADIDMDKKNAEKK